MTYKFWRNWEYTTCCYVEADNLEEAKELASEADWETDNGGEHYCCGTFCEEEDGDGDVIELDFDEI